MSKSGFILRVMMAAGLTVIPLLLHAGWSRIYEEGNWAECVRQTEDGGYIILGSIDGVPYPEDSIIKPDLWLLKTNSRGDALWSKKIENKGYDEAGCVELTIDGGYILCGTPGLIKTDAKGEIQWRRPYPANYVQQTKDTGYILVVPDIHGVWLVKTDENGDTVWTRTLRSGTGYCVREAADGGYLITGELWTDASGLDLGVIKTDEEGKELWTATHGTKYQDCGISLMPTEDGGCVVTGIYSAWGFLCLIRIDAEGETLWEYASDSDSILAEGNCVDATFDGGFIVTGTLEVELSEYSHHLELWLLKFTGSGEMTWERRFVGNMMGSEGYCVQQTSDGGYIIAGNAQFVWLIKTDSMGKLDVAEEPVAGQVPDFEVACNAGSEIKIHYENMPGGIHALLFDASGSRVDEIHSSAVCGTITWGRDYPPGVYFIREATDTQTASRKVILIR